MECAQRSVEHSSGEAANGSIPVLMTGWLQRCDIEKMVDGLQIIHAKLPFLNACRQNMELKDENMTDGK